MTPKEHYIDHLYGVLQEECAELIVAISKRKRFGALSNSPDSPTTNQQHINGELNDLLAVRDMLAEEEGRLYRDDSHIVAKTKKVNRYYMQTFDKDFPQVDQILPYKTKT
jgi:NTP pyrophosphatase (non-canonical NTP hydrolase)